MRIATIQCSQCKVVLAKIVEGFHMQPPITHCPECSPPLEYIWEEMEPTDGALLLQRKRTPQ